MLFFISLSLSVWCTWPWPLSLLLYIALFFVYVLYFLLSPQDAHNLDPFLFNNKFNIFLLCFLFPSLSQYEAHDLDPFLFYNRLYFHFSMFSSLSLMPITLSTFSFIIDCTIIVLCFLLLLQCELGDQVLQQLQ